MSSKKKHRPDKHEAPAEVDSPPTSRQNAQMPAEGALPIAAIGSSAGGLEALQEFFAHLPPDSGIAFVVVTHRHAGRVSLLPELLAKATRMPVVNAEQGVPLEPNHVYVAMPEGVLEISEGVLQVRKAASADDTRYRPIDHFLRFLATDRAEHAIAIILSGAGNDGTVGVQAVKAAGGMVMVQEASSAKYASMPSSAQALGLADFVLSPDQMPGKLIKYVQGPYLRAPSAAAAIPRLSEADITRLLVTLRGRTGHDFTGYKKSTITRRIERRMNVHRLDAPDDYLRYLQQNPQEAWLLMQELLISVTSFFREPQAFEALADKALAPLLKSRPEDHSLRIWAPGCATGEEAYSVAILAHELMHQALRPPRVQIFGTDLDEQAIRFARGRIS